MTGILTWIFVILVFTVTGLFFARRWLDEQHERAQDDDDDDHFKSLPP